MEKKSIFVYAETYERLKKLKDEYSKKLNQKLYYADIQEAFTMVTDDEFVTLYTKLMKSKIKELV